MAHRRISVIALALAVLSGALFMSPTAALSETAAAGSAHTVVMGAVDPAIADPTPRAPATAGRTDRFEYLSYYPSQLRVHRGDTVHFRRDGFHTVTFTPEDGPRRGWLRQDELNDVPAMHGNLPNSDCGYSASAPACVLSEDNRTVNSGWNDLWLKVDVEEGSYEYSCLLHAGMEGELVVVGDDEILPTAAEVEDARRAQVAEDTEAGAALFAASQSPKVEAVDDHLRWTVKVGDITSDQRVAVLRYMPANLEVAPGDEVVFEVPAAGEPSEGTAEPGSEIHTATFARDAVANNFGMARYINPSCDPDDVEAGLPGVPALYPALFVGCAPGTTLEFLLHPHAWRTPTRAPNDAVLTQATVHDSGLMTGAGSPCRTSCDPWTGEPLPGQSTAVFPNEGTFSFVCLVHPEWEMAGAIRVAS